MTVEEAYRYCAALTRSHYENFPVGSALIPRELQPAIHSLYAFMRTADDIADEDRRPGDEPERLARLEEWEAMLSDCERGRAMHPVFIALRATLDHYPLPVQWLRDLLHAFKMDVTVRRYATFEELLTYCRYSANPVGRLILTLFGYRDEERYRLSDAICTSLQLANHWQDVAVDIRKDRIYLPQEDLKRFGVSEQWLQIQSGPSPFVLSSPESAPRVDKATDQEQAFRELLAFECDRTRALFAEGRPLPEKVRGRLRWELRFTWHGGVTILDKINQAKFDVFRHRPVVTPWDWVKIAGRSLW